MAEPLDPLMRTSNAEAMFGGYDVGALHERIEELVAECDALREELQIFKSCDARAMFPSRGKTYLLTMFGGVVGAVLTYGATEFMRRGSSVELINWNDAQTYLFTSKPVGGPKA